MTWVKGGSDKLLRMVRRTFLYIGFGIFVRVVICDTRSISQDENCVQPCSENCETDNCQQCKVGYFGENCSQKCLFCKYESCNKNTGRCTTACKDGYYFGADGICVRCPENCKTCVSEALCSGCESGYKGSSCQEYCESCILGSNCEQTTGYCFVSCKNGISGVYCNLPCDSECESCERLNKSQCLICATGRYGEKCDLFCSQTCQGNVCNKTNGICNYGCIEDFYGTNCEHKHLSKKIIAVIVTIIIVTCGIIIAVVIGTLIYRRWKYTRWKRYEGRSEYLVSGGSYISLTLNDEETHPYEDVERLPENEQFRSSGIEELLIPKSELKNYVRFKREEQYRAEFEQLKYLREKTPLRRTEKISTALLINGYTDKRAYILCKDPPETLWCAFWRLVWHEKCNKVVILSGTSEEGETTHRTFVPKDGQQMKFGDINVDAKDLNSLHFDSYDRRQFDVKMV